MAEDRLQRQRALIGDEATQSLSSSTVAVFGIGGVGSYTVEALARAGVGSLILIDGDRVSESNINRQLIADTTTVGKWKAETAAERVRKINPDCTVTAVNEFADSSNVDRILTEANADYVVDAIDCVTTKLLIALWAQEHNVPVISSMGTGNKLDPSKFVVTDISKTSVCPLARVMRRECKAKGIRKLTVLYSTEEPVKTGLRVPASISYVPSCAGLMIAGHVIRSIINE